ncbi:hypothetical protein O4H61_03445 [Roseovarius aestuarii]|nr:hypothetical protein [Roseovarius aestuarii]
MTAPGHAPTTIEALRRDLSLEFELHSRAALPIAIRAAVIRHGGTLVEPREAWGPVEWELSLLGVTGTGESAEHAAKAWAKNCDRIATRTTGPEADRANSIAALTRKLVRIALSDAPDPQATTAALATALHVAAGLHGYPIPAEATSAAANAADILRAMTAQNQIPRQPRRTPGAQPQDTTQ